MSGLQFVPFLPTYIPPELCQTVGIDPTLPSAPDICMDVVRGEVAESGVSARGLSPEGIGQLEQVVDGAADQGIHLKVVVINGSPPTNTPLRDIATEIGEANPGATVLALSPTFAGSFSPDFDRVTLEAGEDLAKTGDPVQSSKNFVGELTTPHFPWTPFTIVLVLAVAIAVVTTRLLRKWGKRDADSGAAPTSTD